MCNHVLVWWVIAYLLCLTGCLNEVNYKVRRYVASYNRLLFFRTRLFLTSKLCHFAEFYVVDHPLSS
jgi:hypothetical protein